MAKKKAASKPATKKGKSASTSNKLVFHISVMEDGEVVIDEAFGNAYSNRGGRKVEWTITSGFEFKLDFNLIPYAGLDSATVWPFDRPDAVNGNSTGWLDVFQGRSRRAGRVQVRCLGAPGRHHRAGRLC